MTPIPDLSIRRGVAIVLSGPSGTGKSTMAKRVLEADANLRFSVSCTTRPPRPGERDGHDYHFLQRPDFERRVAAGDFLEHAQVHSGQLYGTLKREVRAHLELGTDVLLDIDVQGADQMRVLCAADPYWAAVTTFVFVGPPNLVELERRLRGRGTETEEKVRERLDTARAELTTWRQFDACIINADIHQSVLDLQALLRASRLAVSRLPQRPAWD